MKSRVALCCSLFAGLTAYSEPQKDSLSPQKTAAIRDSIGNDGTADSPSLRVMELAHPSGLPEFDRVVVYAIDFRTKPGQDRANAFPIRPYGTSSPILSQSAFTGDEASAVGAAWRSLDFDEDAGAFCHDPVYGLRFYREDKLLFETSVCWRCSNFYVPKEGGKGWRWDGFNRNRESATLLYLLKRLIPHPLLKAKS